MFRRLQNIKQAYLVYPSAIHTRFEHSLGTVHLANKVSRQLDFKDENIEIIRLAGLLHDIGHGPFSHLFEEVLENVNKKRIDHDRISMMLIKEDKEISEILGHKGEKIIQLLNHEPIDGFGERSKLATDIVSGSLDVDKMDYLRRDSYHIGVAYGQFDLPRLIHTLTSTKESAEETISIDSKGKDAIENYRLGRYLMHAQVYKHHTRLIGDQMFLRALDLAIKDENLKNNLTVDDDLNKDHTEFLEFYKTLDDHSLYQLISNSTQSRQAKIIDRIKKRDLLKRVKSLYSETEIPNAVNRKHIMKMKKQDLRNISDDIAKDAGLEDHEVICHIAEIRVDLFDGEILIMLNGIPKKLDDFSPIKTSKSAINMFYVFGPGDSNIEEPIKKYLRI